MKLENENTILNAKYEIEINKLKNELNILNKKLLKKSENIKNMNYEFKQFRHQSTETINVTFFYKAKNRNIFDKIAKTRFFGLRILLYYFIQT